MKQVFNLRNFMGVFFISSFILMSCGQSTDISTQYTPDQIIRAIISAQKSLSNLEPLLPENDYYHEYLANIYQLDADGIIEGAIFFSSGMVANELAVFRISDRSLRNKIVDSLTHYKDRRAEAFMGYAPEEASILENAMVATNGDYVALLICPDAKDAEVIFLACFNDNLPERGIVPAVTEKEENIEQPIEIEMKPEDNKDNKYVDKPVDEPDTFIDDSYNHDAILAAWFSGDINALSPKNLSILEMCVNVINELIKDDMDDFEKELAIHDWIIDWADYDTETLSNAEDASPDPDNDNPYGLIFGKRAICMGYTLTFQLFMDMLGIECIIVNGVAAHDPDGAHAWNMVFIDDNWYCVDVTWDDPINSEQTYEMTHRFFNTTTYHMIDTGHIWDENSTPMADTDFRIER